MATSFSRTDLRRGVSGAKFDAESDSEVRFAVALQKPNQNREKLNFRCWNLVFHFFSWILEEVRPNEPQNQIHH